MRCFCCKTKQHHESVEGGRPALDGAACMHCEAAVATEANQRRRAVGDSTWHAKPVETLDPGLQEWGVDLDQLNGRPNATTAAYTKFLLRLAEGPQARGGF